MSRWFRMYDEVLDDPKVQRLSGEDFKAWVNILCLASRNAGTLPPVEDIAFALRLDAKKASAVLSRLEKGGLIGPCETGIGPHKWNERQYKSDVSTDRVKRFRERSKPVAETANGTAPDTEADTETEKKKEGDAADAASTSYIFSGRHIKLTEFDFARWRKSYHAIPDLAAELTALDAWLDGPGDKKQGKWFHTISGALNRKHQEILSAEQAGLVDCGTLSPC